MITHPFGIRRRVEKVWREGGWGPVQTWPIERPGRPPLVFKLRVPLGLELIDVRGLADTAAGASPLVAQGAAALGAAAQGGVFLVAALRTTKEPETERTLVATLTAAISDVTGPPSVEEIRAGLSDDPHTRHEVIKLTDLTTQITSLTTEPAERDAEPDRLLVLQYLTQTPFGGVVVSFSTTLTDAMTAKAHQIYHDIVRGVSIDERPAA